MNNNQQDPRWANIKIGDGTIGIFGCLVTVIGDAIGTTPGDVVARLKEKNGFSGNNVVWNYPDGTKPIEQAFPGITVNRVWTYNNEDVLAQLAKGNRVIVEVPAAPIHGTGSHWVEYIGGGQLKDPWTAHIRPTGDFPNPTGYAIISGTWQPAQAAPVNTEGLNTHGLDPANEQSNQVVFDTWQKVKDGLYIPISQFTAAQQTIDDLQKQILDLQSKHNEDQKEIVNLNSSLTSLSSSNKDYTTQAMDAENIATTYKNFMETIADTMGIMDNNQTDQELHDEILREIIHLQQNQKTESNPSPQETQDVWETSLKNIVNWLLAHGFADFLKQNNLHVIDASGNFVDDSVADRVIVYLDDRFHRLDILEQAQQAVSTFKTQVGKSRNLFAQIVGIFWVQQPNA